MIDNIEQRCYNYIKKGKNMEEYILDLIPNNRFITRLELTLKTNVTDREVRRIISKLKQNHTIISMSSGKGYRKCKYTTEMSKGEIEKELSNVKHCINEINHKKKIYNMQLRQYIAYLKELEKNL